MIHDAFWKILLNNDGTIGESSSSMIRPTDRMLTFGDNFYLFKKSLFFVESNIAKCYGDSKVADLDVDFVLPTYFLILLTFVS
jgi:hypothetical protein